MTERLLLIIGVTVLCMLSPGPDMVLVMRNTLVVNRRAGGLTALGVLTGNLVHIGYCALGLGVLLTRSAAAYEVLRYVGALYLAYLAVRTLWSRNEGLVDLRASMLNPSRGPYLHGFLNNVLNPKGVLFYLGVFTQVITPDVAPWQMIVLIGTMLAVSTVFWLVFVQTLHLPVVRLRLNGWTRTIDLAFGIVLLALAVGVAWLR